MCRNVTTSGASVEGPFDYDRLVSSMGCNGYQDDRQAYEMEMKEDGSPNESIIL